MSHCLEMGDHLVRHGDGVKDIAFTVQDCDFLVQVLHLQTHSLQCLYALAHIINDKNFTFFFSCDIIMFLLSILESPRARCSYSKGALQPRGPVWESQAGRASNSEKTIYI